MSIVFDNTETFKNLSADDTAKIMMTTKLYETNQNIIMARDIYTAESMFNDLDEAITSYVMAVNKAITSYVIDEENEEKQRLCEQKITEILENVRNSSDEVYDCFTMLFMAEYKERIYWSLYDCKKSDIEDDILAEYDNIINNYDYDLFCILQEHYHDPEHYVFQNKNNTFYSFYEQIEVKGYSILDIRESGIRMILEEEDSDEE